MLELLNDYSVSEILIFIVILAIAVKETVSFYDWAKGRIKQSYDKNNEQEEEIDTIEDRIAKDEKNIQNLTKTQNGLKDSIDDIMKKIDLLIVSDKDDIKAYITREHHYFCYQKGWIDDYSLDCILRRFGHYKKEGGNSFIEEFINDIKELPKQPLQEEKEKIDKNAGDKK